MIDVKYESSSTYRGYEIVTDDEIGIVEVNGKKFDNESEAVEYIDELLDKEPELVKQDEKKEYVVTTIINNGNRMFVKNNGGVTFNVDSAKLYTYIAARDKAEFMTIESKQGYTWEFMRI